MRRARRIASAGIVAIAFACGFNSAATLLAQPIAKSPAPKAVPSETTPSETTTTPDSAAAPLAATPNTVRRAIVSPKLLRYAERIVRQYDIDKSGELGPEEWKAMRGEPAVADLNHDGNITVTEFAQHVADFGAGRAIRLAANQGSPLSPEETAAGAVPGGTGIGGANTETAEAEAAAAMNRDPRRSLKYFATLPAGIPAWFVERDADGDSQLTLAEYSPKLMKNDIADFNRFDANHDGLLTPQEFLRAEKAPKGAAGSALPGSQ